MSFVMSLVPHAFSWIVEVTLVSSGLLCVGYLAAAVFRHAADRLRILQWTLAVTLVSLVAVALPSYWTIAIPVTLDAIHDRSVLASENSPPLSQLPLEHLTATEQPLPSGQILNLRNSAHSATLASLPPRNSDQSSVLAARVTTLGTSSEWTGIALRYSCGLYLAGIGVCAARWCRARWRLRRLFQRGSQVPPAIRDQFAQLSHASGQHVRLRISEEIATPITLGLRCPVIMLPQCVWTEQQPSTLRYFLAHEWAHVRRRDAWTWQLVVCLQLFLYYNPLYWWTRRALLVAMDRLGQLRPRKT